jgi:hypothetical protein
VLLGRIPHEHIDSVDWKGNEYYGFPHIYCFFANKSSRMNSRPSIPNSADSHTRLAIYNEVASYEEVRNFSKKIKMFFRPVQIMERRAASRPSGAVQLSRHRGGQGTHRATTRARNRYCNRARDDRRNLNI